MKIIELQDGSPAWVCDTVEWAIYPERYEALKDWGAELPESKLLKPSSATGSLIGNSVRTVERTSANDVGLV
jgi:hypothetical protein